MKIAAFYARVSSDHQEKEETIDSQIEAIIEQAKKDGYEIPENLRFIDDGWTGTTLKRPDLDRMRDAAKNKDFEVIYFYDRGRIARKYSYQELIIDELQEEGIAIVVLDNSVSENPEEKIYNGIKGLFAEYERIKICERMRRGKLYKAKQGIYFSGSVNYGYKYIPKTKDQSGKIEINLNESKNVELIFKLIGEQKNSIRKVIIELDRLGIKPRKSKRGVWTTSTLSQILRDTVYIGKAYYNRTVALQPENPLKQSEYKKVIKTSRKLKPQQEWIGIPSPRIISDELFTSVQAQLSLNSRYSPRNKKFDYKLAGLIYCHCGCRMSGAKSFAQHYYRCISRIKKFPEKDYCKSAGVNVQRIEKPVWIALNQLLTQPGLIDVQVKRWKESIPEEHQSNSETCFLDEIKKLDEKEKRFTEAYGDQLIAMETYRSLMEDIMNHRQKIKVQKEETSKLPMIVNRNLINSDSLKEATAILIGQLQESDQRQVLLRLVEKVMVDKDQKFAKISGYIPLYYNLNNNQNVTQRSIHRYCGFA
jgi:site-specific DNA recombinase